MLAEEIKPNLEESLIKALNVKRRNQAEIDFVLKAFNFAFDKHITQKRRSGQPYITHPVAVALSLIDLNCDKEAICSGLLHDVVEDTKTSHDDLCDLFGEEVADIVDGVTKLSKLNFKSSEDEQATNFRKMLLAIAKDVRVVLVKLADRLHNMQTLNYLREEKQIRISRETLDIFAPLANRFGLRNIQIELEDLCLKYLNKEEFSAIKELVKSKKHEREAQIQKLKIVIKQVLDDNSIRAEIQGRAKHFYSIFAKLQQKNVNVNSDEQLNELPIYDLLGIRILVDNIKDCYAALGVIHETFRPMPGRFKDYIALPKSNMYQSLHTTVIIPWDEKPLEVQIRSYEMHEIAEHGIAAHWHYKDQASNQADLSDAEELKWLKQLVSWHTDVSEAKEYFSGVKNDVLTQEVYILTPKGDVIALPVGSTPVDFAYKIHTRIGDTCTGAIVNEKMVSINYKLQNGDMVEIVTSKNGHPNLSWLNFVKTHQAKYRIKSWYKKQNRDRHINIGEQLFAEHFGKAESEKLLKSEDIKQVLGKLNQKNVEDLLAAIGSGDQSIAQVETKLSHLRPQKEQDLSKEQLEKFKTRKAPAKGDKADIPELDGLLYTIAKCCMPIPGEAVIGTISKGKGITIHRADCYNVKQVEPERLMQINWKNKEMKTYPARINIEVIDRIGMVKDILTLIADGGFNIRDFKVTERPTKTTALLKVILDIQGVEELKQLTQKMLNLSDVLQVERL
ncbi:MAG: bifunctional (p)ppGpp synthetase/guanosine-3',5'-bis(diphosphate) 3'-pyrophosphohydrolase [Candidatus Caenarcaniphilales bacterium]|nr:bifunctional (p)ppGpp synthetase/guanosine-3',5'-bis(diphosphate) 3'-pyrophosphohydrolase [Candidatus Caenarcaniphilales bacterium]